MKSFACAITAIAALGGCAAVKVKPIGPDEKVSHVCIQQNPQVLVEDFVAVMQEGFQKHGITSEVYPDTVPAKCRHSVTYTARQSWDLAPYLAEAQIDIFRDRSPVASANHRWKSGLNKWADTRAKILPVIDVLLAQGEPAGNVAVMTSMPPAVPLRTHDETYQGAPAKSEF